MTRAHDYATEAEAAAAIEAIDAARDAARGKPTESATTILGARSTERAVLDGLATPSPLAVTEAGAAAGYAVEGGRLVRRHEIPARTWALPTPLRSGAQAGRFFVPVCPEAAGREVTVRGTKLRVPDDTTARTIARSEVADPDGAR